MPFVMTDLMVPFRAGFSTSWSRLPGDHRASSLTPLFMIIKKYYIKIISWLSSICCQGSHLVMAMENPAFHHEINLWKLGIDLTNLQWTVKWSLELLICLGMVQVGYFQPLELQK